MTPQETYLSDLTTYPAGTERARREAKRAERRAHAQDHEVLLAQRDEQRPPKDEPQPLPASAKRAKLAIEHTPDGETPEVSEPVVRGQSKGKTKGRTQS